MAPGEPLKIGLSPCPNDTFIFGALIKGLVSQNLIYEFTLEDVETLNLWAQKRILPVSKLSFGVLPFVINYYELLPIGAALGYGCGPLVVSLKPSLDLSEACVAIPGLHTTAYCLLRFYSPLGKVKPLRYDQIIPALLKGEVEAGLLIHEGRFVYQKYGLHKLVDLGEWWEKKTGLPLPLGGIFVRRDLLEEIKLLFLEDLQRSLTFAQRDISPLWEFIQKYAQEMAPETIHQHIKTFVNRFTYDLGEEGKRAVLTFLEFLKKERLIEPGFPPPFFEGGRA